MNRLFPRLYLKCLAFVKRVVLTEYFIPYRSLTLVMMRMDFMVLICELNNSSVHKNKVNRKNYS